MKANNSAPNHLDEEQIRIRAYQIYASRGCQSGSAMDDWLQAEYELRQLPIAKLAELKPVRYSSRGLQVSALVALVQAALLLGSTAVSNGQS